MYNYVYIYIYIYDYIYICIYIYVCVYVLYISYLNDVVSCCIFTTNAEAHMHYVPSPLKPHTAPPSGSRYTTGDISNALSQCRRLYIRHAHTHTHAHIYVYIHIYTYIYIYYILLFIYYLFIIVYICIEPIVTIYIYIYIYVYNEHTIEYTYMRRCWVDRVSWLVWCKDLESEVAWFHKVQKSTLILIMSCLISYMFSQLACYMIRSRH